MKTISVHRLLAVFFSTMLFLVFIAPLPCTAQKKIDEDELAVMKQPRELAGNTWNLPPTGPPLGRFPGVTQDGFQLTAIYYPGNVDKETVPAVVFHGPSGNRGDFSPLISKLREGGFAVVAPDLRGHGKSNKRYTYEGVPGVPPGGPPPGFRPTIPNAMPAPKLIEIEPEDLQPQDYLAMARYDLPMIVNFVKMQNDKAMLNANKLVLIGNETGAALATYWAMQNWTDRGSARNAKMLVLINPTPLQLDHEFASYFKNASKAFKENVNVLIITSSGSSGSASVATKIKETLLTPKELEEDKPGFESRVPVISLDSTLVGAELLKDEKSGIVRTITDFLSDRFGKYKEKDNRWSKSK